MNTMCLVFLGWGFAAAVSFAGDTAPEAEYPQLPGRTQSNVVIRIKDEGEFSRHHPPYPYVDTNGIVTILPGERHIIEFEIRDGQPVNPKWVKEPTAGKDYIILKFKNTGEMAYLSTENRCSRILTMKCRHQRIDKKGQYETGLNPLKPGMFSGDSWPPKVESLMLFDFRFWDDYDKAFNHER